MNYLTQLNEAEMTKNFQFVLTNKLSITFSLFFILGRWAYSAEIDYSEVGSNYNRFVQNRNFVMSNQPELMNSTIMNEKSEDKVYASGKIILIDTTDATNCRLTKEKLLNENGMFANDIVIANLCDYDPKRPVVSVTILDQSSVSNSVLTDSPVYRKEIELNSLVTPQKSLAGDTRNILYGSVGMAGLIFMMPESISKWDKSKLGNGVLDQYLENVKAGPVTDQDDWAINYIGHPISGAAYYMVARHANLSMMSSFGYSVIMSTFFWEYGVEAFAEVPSRQDLWITPVIGSIFGELFYRWESKIKSNENRVLGSKRLGNFFLVLFNPAGRLSAKINHFFDRKIIQTAQTNLITSRKKFTGRNGVPFESTYVGLEFNFRFNEPLR